MAIVFRMKIVRFNNKKGESMKQKFAILIGILLACVQFYASADTCALGIKGSGKGGLPNIMGEGTSEHPFELQYGKDLCDITLVKEGSGTNKAYYKDTIYFQYKYKNVPLLYENANLNQFIMALAMSPNSEITPSIVTDDDHPYDKKTPCKIFNNPAKDHSYNAYNATCLYTNKNTDDDKPLRISGTIRFSISIKGEQEIRRIVDENGNATQGAATLSIKWLTPPQDEKSNYSK